MADSSKVSTPSSPDSSPERKLLRFQLGAVLLISLAACGAQFFGAFLTGSIALLAESVHLSVDLLGLSLAFVVTMLPQRRSPRAQERLEALSALIQSVLIVGIGVYAAIRGLRGLLMPHALAGEYILVFASVGLIANLVCGAILYSSRKANLNLRAAFLEVISDALGSLVVIGGGIAVLVFGFLQADGIAALVLAALMIPRGVSILRRALRSVFPGRRIWPLVTALILAVLFGLGVSQLHQRLLPQDLHFDPAPVENYSWTQPSGKLKLSFDRKGSVVTLSDGCSVARAGYESVLGGVVFSDFYPEAKAGCATKIPEKVLGASSGYYSADFRSLGFFTESGKKLTSFSSKARSEDQQRADSWRPVLEILFKL